MAKDTKRSRGSNWSHEETVVLAVLKREAFLRNETGTVMWKKISQKFSSRFPDQRRSDDQCRWRWDTLIKDYKHIEDYCVVTGQDPWQLDVKELASMKLDTAYRWDWYKIVREVCMLKRKGRRDSGLVTGMMSNGSNTGLLPEHSPARNTLPRPPQASTSESSSADNLQPLSGPSRFEVLKKLLEDVPEWSAIIEEPDMAEIPSEDEQVETRTVPRGLERECPSHHQQYGAVNIAGGMGINMRHEAGGMRHGEDVNVFEASSWGTDDSNMMATLWDLSRLKISTASKSTSIVFDGTISGQASGCNGITQGLETHSDLQSDSEEDQQSQPCALQVIELEVFPCCDSCIRKWTKNLEAMDGVEKPVIFDRVNMKVSVTASAEPEDVLKQVQLVKKSAVMWRHQK